MEKRHTNLTPVQVQNKIANWIFLTIIISWAFMLIVFCSKPVWGANGEDIEQVQEDSNLENKKPTPRWRLNSNWYSQRYIELHWNTRDDRAIELLEHYDFDGVRTWSSIKTIARIWRVQPEIIICIAYADSSLGKFLKTDHNYWNVGNTDSGKTQSYDNMEQWFNAIGKVLNNRYLSYIYTVDYLSRYKNKTWSIYATSEENHFNNTVNCLGMIHNKKIADNWNFRR